MSCLSSHSIPNDDAMQQNASIKSDEEINAEMRAFQQSKEERERKAKERKVRMRELERQTALKAVKSGATGPSALDRNVIS